MEINHNIFAPVDFHGSKIYNFPIEDVSGIISGSIQIANYSGSRNELFTVAGNSYKKVISSASSDGFNVINAVNSGSYRWLLQNLVPSGSGISSTDQLTEGATNKYFTAQRVKDTGDTLYSTKSDAGKVSIKSFNAVGDGVVDDTQAFVNALAFLNTSDIKTLQLDKKTYRVNTGVINLFNGITIKGQGGSKIITTSNSGYIFSGNNVSDIALLNLYVSAPNDAVKLVYFNNSTKINISQINLDLASLIRIDNSNYLNIDKCKGFNSYTNTTTRITTLPCVDLYLTNYVTIDNCIMNGYNFGVQYWGGDANLNGTPQPLTATRGCTDITVSNSTFNDNFAGFWGSMGRNITALNVKTDNSRDVGIDAEGSINVRFINCIAKDATYGGFATFFLCDDVEWTNCKSYTTTTGKMAFGIAGGTSGGRSGRIKISNLTAISTVESYGGYVTNSGCAYSDFILDGCTFQNISLDLNSVTGHKQVIKNSKFISTISLNSSQQLSCGNSVASGSEAGDTIIKNNEFINQYALNNNTVGGNGPQIFHQNDSLAPKTTIEDNKFIGFALDFVLKAQTNTTTDSLRARVVIQNNKLYSANEFVESAPSGKLNLNTTYFNNTNGLGIAIRGGINTASNTTANFDLSQNFTAGNVLAINSQGIIVPTTVQSNASTASVDLTKVVQGYSAKSRSIQIATGSFQTIDLPSGFTSVTSAVTGMPYTGSFWNVYNNHYENISSGGDFWRGCIAQNLGTPSVVYVGGRDNTGAWLGWKRIALSDDYYVNVKDFGALGNGIQNDAPFIQAAVDYAKFRAIANGGNVRIPVKFPPGIYNCNQVINCTNATGLWLVGSEGRYVNTHVNGNNGGIIFDFTGSSLSGCEGFTFTSYPNNTSPSTIGVQFALSEDTNGNQIAGLNCKIHNCYFNLGDNPTVNGGLGTIGIINIRSEEFTASDLLISANNGVIFSNQRDLSPLGVTFTASSTYSSVIRGNGSMGVIDFTGQMSIQNLGARRPAIQLLNANSFHFDGYLVENYSPGTNNVAIRLYGQADNINYSGTIEGFSTICDFADLNSNINISTIIANQRDITAPLFDVTASAIFDSKLVVSFGNPAEFNNGRVFVYHAPVNNGNSPATGGIANCIFACSKWVDNSNFISDNILKNSGNIHCLSGQPFRKEGGFLIDLKTLNAVVGTKSSNNTPIVFSATHFSNASSGINTVGGQAGYYQLVTKGTIKLGNGATSNAICVANIEGYLTVIQDTNGNFTGTTGNVVITSKVAINPSYMDISNVDISFDGSDTYHLSAKLTITTTGSANGELVSYFGTSNLLSDFNVKQAIIFN